MKRLEIRFHELVDERQKVIWLQQASAKMNPVTDAALLRQIDRYYKDVEETEKKRADYRK